MYHVDIITPPRFGGPFNWASGLQNQLKKSAGFRGRHRYHYNEILSALFYTKADLVHAAFPYPLKPSNKPFILTIKGDYKIENPLIAKLYQQAARQADLITVPSLFLKEKLNLKRAIVIPNAVPISRNLYKQRKSAVKLLTVTNLWFPKKAAGIKTLIKLINQLGDSHLELTVLGEGKFKKELEQFAAKHAKFIVSFPGWKRPATYYPETDVFVYYSYHDNMPNSILEAQAAGLPIISNQVGAVSEILTNNSGLIARNRIEYLKYLKLLISSSVDRKVLSIKAHSTSRKLFSWNKIVHQYEKLYTQLLN